MDKELKIVPPEGYEVDTKNSTFACIKFKPIKPQLPTTWEEFCEIHPVKPGECYIKEGIFSNIAKYDRKCQRLSTNILPSKEYAEAVLALCQLIQIRDYYNDGWEPDWNCNNVKYVIRGYAEGTLTDTTSLYRVILAFKTRELRDEFYKNFKSLIEIAKPLL